MHINRNVAYKVRPSQVFVELKLFINFYKKRIKIFPYPPHIMISRN